MPKKLTIRLIIILIFIFLFSGSIYSQVVVKGIVRDSLSNEPLSYVSVYFKNTVDGDVTANDGTFSVMSRNKSRTVVFSMVGYKDKVVHLKKDLKNHNLKILLAPTTYDLKEVVVKPKKEKYSNKNNPAVDFVMDMIAKKQLSDPKNHDYYSYEHYEKMAYALNDFTKEKNISFDNKRFGFIFNYVDTSNISGKPILVVSFKESIEDVHYRKEPKEEKHIVKAFKSDGIDELLPQESVQLMLQEVFSEVNIFDNHIMLMTNKFVSPLSSLGPSFYKYYMLDTVLVDGKKYVNLGFVPRNSESFGFTGMLNVALDSTKFIRQAKLNVPKDINLNFVHGMSITQEFSQMPDGSRILTKDDISVELNVAENLQGVFARRLNTYKNHSFENPGDSVFEQKATVIQMDDAMFKDEKYWADNRHDTVEGKENHVKEMMAELRKEPIYYYTECFLRVMFTGYIPIEGEHSRFEYGPFNTTFSKNKLEGFRFRVGGMTTAYLNRHWFANGYVAYGCKDEKLKYKGQLEYSFLSKKEYPTEFPVHSLTATYQYDTDELGQHYIYTNKDNMFMSLKRLDDNRIAYQRSAGLAYKQEFYNHFSYDVKTRYMTEYATVLVPFWQEKNGSIFPVNDFSVSDLEVGLRYAPNEKFYQTRHNRFPINHECPVFTLTHSIGEKGLLGSDYSSNITEFSFRKRIWFSFLGYADVVLKAGKQWNKVPFPLLMIPNANMSYIIQMESYSLMNAMEFLNDQYAALDYTYYLNGLLLNRIPLLKKLKFREVLSFRCLYGSLSDKNDPSVDSDDLYLFPEGSYKMDNTPYMEAGVGVENVLKILRFDYVWRLTYRDHPNIDRSGLRFRCHIKF
ncbi:MAG TPA: DUF5686 family protein [Paludibacteraceae bacterium]|nr:DUF5686 family protein [Paludibacteraceae bacterium]HQF50353.1 DUF5686 family protein [Paludibacteraceae bacterium]